MRSWTTKAALFKEKCKRKSFLLLLLPLLLFVEDDVAFAFAADALVEDNVAVADVVVGFAFAVDVVDEDDVTVGGVVVVFVADVAAIVVAVAFLDEDAADANAAVVADAAVVDKNQARCEN